MFRIFPHSSARYPHAESRSTPDGQALFVVQCRTTKHLRVLVDLQKFGVRVVPADAVTNQTCELPQDGEQHFTAPQRSPLRMTRPARTPIRDRTSTSLNSSH